MKYTISMIRVANKANGYNYFEPETMRFFRSRVERGVYNGPGGVYFITSEQFVGSDGTAHERKYTVRQFHPENGSISTVGKFNTWRFLEDARVTAKHKSKRRVASE